MIYVHVEDTKQCDTLLTLSDLHKLLVALDGSEDGNYRLHADSFVLYAGPGYPQ